MEVPILRGERVRLDALRLDDASRLVEITDPEVDRWIRWNRRDPFTIESARRAIAQASGQWARDSAHKQWAIREIDSAQLVGRLDVKNATTVVNRWINVWLAAGYRQSGYGSEAVGLALDYVFEVLGWPWVEAQIDLDNLPSIKLAASLGGQFEGQGTRIDDGHEIVTYRFSAGPWRQTTGARLTAPPRLTGRGAFAVPLGSPGARVR